MNSISVRDQLVEHIPALRNFALRLSHDRDIAEDLVQDCFAKALSNLDKFRSGTNLQAWLFTILRNSFYSECRKSKREREGLNQEAPIEIPVDPIHDQRLLLDKVVVALRHLTEEHREALMLVGVLEMSYQEAAIISGVAVGTMKSRISRARTELHDAMGRAKG